MSSNQPMESLIRYPAVPLIVHDPYFSVWSKNDSLYGGWPVHWTGKGNGIAGICRIDDQSYVFCGRPDGVECMKQTSVQVFPLRTVYSFEAGGIELILTFLTPSLLNDLDRLARPVTYLIFDLKSLDGNEHQARLYFDVGGELCTNGPGDKVVWGHTRSNVLDVMRMGTMRQDILVHSGDDLRIDWGYIHLAVPLKYLPKTVIASNFATRRMFVQSGEIPLDDDSDQPRIVRDGWVSLTTVMETDIPAGEVVSRHLLIAYDDLRSIEFLEQKLAGYWSRDGMRFPELLTIAETEFVELRKTCETYDEKWMSEFISVGGENYASLASLAYRQTIGAHKLVADENGEALFFSKENFSNGCIATVDVTYPSSPLFLLAAPELLKGMLRPILKYARSPRWKFPFAPHDLGVYPLANGQVYGGGERTGDNQMPVEECGNMLLLAAALLILCGEKEFVAKDFDLYTRWADYLLEKGYDPERQLCSDDFAGHLAHNTNLALKAILAIGAYGRMAALLSDSERAQKFDRIASELANRWKTDADDGDHYRLAFDCPGSWSLKYNLIWDHLLELNYFPEVARKEVAFYRRMRQTYGVPLDSRRSWTKLDWFVWAATLTENREDFDALMDLVYRWINEGGDRVPLTDWYDTHTGQQCGFQARSVLGAVYLPLLIARCSGKNRKKED